MKKMSFSLTRFMSFSAIAVLSSFLLTSCLKSNDDNNNNVDAAGLMAFNLVADKSPVSIRLSGNAFTTVPLAYNSFTGSYLGIFPGSRTVEVYDANGLLTSSPAFLFEPEKYYSLFVAGANGSYRNILLEDNFDALSATSAQAYVRYINAIPDSARPNVVISSGGSPVVSDQPSFATVSEFKAITPGQISIDLNNGTTIDADRTITVENRKVYTVLLTGIPGSAQTPVEIKFIENGTLDENDSNRIADQGSAKKAN